MGFCGECWVGVEVCWLRSYLRYFNFGFGLSCLCYGVLKVLFKKGVLCRRDLFYL